jgi:hypothetical protein
LVSLVTWWLTIPLRRAQAGRASRRLHASEERADARIFDASRKRPLTLFSHKLEF